MTLTVEAPVGSRMSDLVERLGSIPLDRIAAIPAPGTATEVDLLGHAGLYELVDRMLVEKPMGAFEARLAFVLGWFLENFMLEHPLGIIFPADTPLRLMSGLIRLPDVSFVRWDRFPEGRLTSEPVPGLVPDLAVEVISTGNTPSEMERKRAEYFEAGVPLVWYAYPESRTVRVYTSMEDYTLLGEDDILDGGAVLPGFSLPIRDWFERAAGKRPV